MAKLTPEEEKKKKELFEAMSPKTQKRILKRGYEEWDPFMMPKEPLAYKLRQEAKGEKVALDSGHELISQGIFRGQDRYQGMYDFSCWYEKWRKQHEDKD